MRNSIFFTWINRMVNAKFFHFIIFGMIGVVLYISLYNNVKPEKMNIKKLEPAEQTIRSPITIIDEESTEKKRQQAVSQVQDVFILKKEYTQNRVDLITTIFQSAIEVKEDIVKSKKAFEDRKDQQDKEVTDEQFKEPTIEQQLESLKEKLTDDVIRDLSDVSLTALLKASQQELSIAKDIVVTAINQVMNTRIPASEVENAKRKVEEAIRYTSLRSELKNATIELARYAVVQNEFYDPKATEELRKQTYESVEPVRILQGQIIVEEGQLISSEIYRQLELVGLVETDQTYLPFIGLLLFILIVISFMYYYFNEDIKKKGQSKHELMLLASVFLISLLIMKILAIIKDSTYGELYYLYPIAMATMLIKILIHERLAIVTAIILSLSGTIMFNDNVTGTFNFPIGMYILISGLAGVLFLSNQNGRAKILQTGIIVSAVNMIVLLTLLFLRNTHLSGLDYGAHFLLAVISGLGSSVLTIGLLPFFEAGFGILSTMKLIELSNPNHPLLKKILTEAPGTYHHSVMVANLAESACEAIGANGLLARVGCYYHDIGKTKRPKYFIENQMNHYNPHDDLPPETSKNIIVAHAVDGAQMLRENKMPKEIVDIAEQHHGTTLLKYFYHKAVESGKEVNEDDFRYPGPKPQTKEAAIIGIADSVEAAVRSMNNATPEQIEKIVHAIINDRIHDGQFSECDLTFKEIQTIAQTLCNTLNGIFHNRIEYPELNKKES